MKKLGYTQLEKLRDKWLYVEDEVKVTDFNSALRRCEQLCAERYIEEKRNQQRSYIAKARQENRNGINDREIQYRRKQYKVNKQTRKFIAIVCQKYGSLSKYHFSKIK